MTSLADETRRADLAKFLVACRQRLQPEAVGLAGTRRRRTPGLRREEVATLADISLVWYTRLEQGRHEGVSAVTLAAVGRALRLAPAELRYLFRLAGQELPPAPTGAAHLDHDAVYVFDRFRDSPAYLTDHVMNVLGWNRAATEVFGGPHEGPRHLLRFVFADSDFRARLQDWNTLARGYMERFRADTRNAEDPRAVGLVNELKAASPEFNLWWEKHRVGGCPGTAVIINHPTVGQLMFNMKTLFLDWSGEAWLTVYIPTTGSNTANILRSLLTAPAPETLHQRDQG